MHFLPCLRGRLSGGTFSQRDIPFTGVHPLRQMHTRLSGRVPAFSKIVIGIADEGAPKLFQAYEPLVSVWFTGTAFFA